MCIVYIIPQQGTLYASHVELALFLSTLFGGGDYTQKDSSCFDLPPLENGCVTSPLFLYPLVQMNDELC